MITSCTWWWQVSQWRWTRTRRPSRLSSWSRARTRSGKKTSTYLRLPHTKLAINQPTSHSCLSSVNQSTAHTVANQLTSHRWQSISPPRTVDTQVPVNQFTAPGGHTGASQSIPLKLWTHSCQSISPTHTVATESIHLAQCTQLLINQSTSQSCQSINPPHTLHYRYVPYGL